MNNVAPALRITEVMYHPADPNDEFIEFKNIGCEGIEGDVDNDCDVDIADLTVIVNNWMKCYRYPDCITVLP